MRIAVNTRLLVPQKMDGIGRFTFETLIRITRNNPNVKFDFFFDRNPPKEFDFPKNVTLIRIGLPARLPFLWFLWFEVSIKRFINKNNYDLFLSPEGWIPGGLNCKSLGIIHDLNFEHHPENIVKSHRKFLLHYFPKYAKRATRIGTVSEYSKYDISETYKINGNKIDVMYNGANNIFKPIKDSEKQRVRNIFSKSFPFFIFIGTIHPRKNLESLLKAFDLFKKNNTNHKLLVVGNRKWWPENLETTYQNLIYKSDVIFLGRKTDDELAELLASAEALTYIPYFEGFGIPILEAFQAGTPVITSNVTSMPEVALDAAILCSPNDIESIANGMTLISTNKELKKNLISKGKERAKFFSWEKTSDLLWASIKETIHGKA
jgi:glycosyltransferase involved in cell wall biosynthesis